MADGRSKGIDNESTQVVDGDSARLKFEIDDFESQIRKKFDELYPGVDLASLIVVEGQDLILDYFLQLFAKISNPDYSLEELQKDKKEYEEKCSADPSESENKDDLVSSQKINNKDDLLKLYNDLLSYNLNNYQILKFRSKIIGLITFDITPLLSHLHTLDIDDSVSPQLLVHIKAILTYQSALKTSADNEQFCDNFRELLQALFTLNSFINLRGVLELGLNQPSTTEKNETDRKSPHVHISLEPDWLDRSWTWMAKNWKKVVVGMMVTGVVAAGTVFTLGALGIVLGGIGIGAAVGSAVIAGGVGIGVAADITKEKKLTWKHVAGMAFVGMGLAVATVFTLGAAGAIAGAGFGFAAVATAFTAHATGAGVGITLGIGLIPSVLAVVGRGVVSIKNTFSRSARVAPILGEEDQKINKIEDETLKFEVVGRGFPKDKKNVKSALINPEVKDPGSEAVREKRVTWVVEDVERRYSYSTSRILDDLDINQESLSPSQTDTDNAVVTISSEAAPAELDLNNNNTNPSNKIEETLSHPVFRLKINNSQNK